MATWSCPHCGTPQDEAAECWVCHRSTVCCATCRHLRTAMAGGILYCGLDRTRAELRGDEIKPCWEAVEPALASNDRSIELAVVDASDGWTLFGDPAAEAFAETSG